MTRTWHEYELTSGQDLEALGDIDKLQTWLAGARAPLIDRIPMPDDRPWSFLPYPRHEQVGASVLWRWKQASIVPKPAIMLSPIPGSGASVVNAIDQPKVMIPTYATAGAFQIASVAGFFQDDSGSRAKFTAISSLRPEQFCSDTDRLRAQPLGASQHSKVAMGKRRKSHEHLRLLPRPHRLLDAYH